MGGVKQGAEPLVHRRTDCAVVRQAVPGVAEINLGGPTNEVDCSNSVRHGLLNRTLPRTPVLQLRIAPRGRPAAR
jgi:hypothetical protein